MQSSVMSSGTTEGSIKLHPSHAYLCRALEYEDDWSADSYCVTYHVAITYLAVLYFVTGQYETASNHCDLVISAIPCSVQSKSNFVVGRCLPKIDDDVDNALGLVVLYQFLMKTRTNELQRPLECTVFSPNLLACYIKLMSCYCNEIPANYQQGCRERSRRSSSAMPSGSERTTSKSLSSVRRYRDNIRESRVMFIGDILLCFITSRSTKWKRADIHPPVKTTTHLSSWRFNYIELRRLLIKFSVGHLSLLCGTPVTSTCIEAMFALHCGKYENCYEMSELSVRSLVDVHQLGDLNEPISGDIAHYVDDKLASIAAVAVLIKRPDDDSSKTTVHTVSQLNTVAALVSRMQNEIGPPGDVISGRPSTRSSR